MRTAVAYKCRDLEKDAKKVAGLTVECGLCDPDNPRGVPRKKCPRCMGTGLAPVGIAAIAEEIHAGRLELLRGGKGKSTGEEYAD